MFTIRPERWARMTGTAARLISQGPRRLTATTRSKTSIGMSATSARSGPWGAAALFTRTSSRPKRCTASATMRSASASTDTSPRAEAAVPPAAVMSATSAATPPQPAERSSCCRLGTPAGCRSVTTTAVPRAASVRAIACPIPSGFPHPVTSATRWAVTSAPTGRPRGW
jgi:hypothetical protein